MRANVRAVLLHCARVPHSTLSPSLAVSHRLDVSLSPPRYPLSAIATRSELSAEQAADGGLGCMGGTYGGNAVCCAAALATLDVFRDEDVVGNSHRRGEQLRDGLRRVAANPATKGNRTCRSTETAIRKTTKTPTHARARARRLMHPSGLRFHRRRMPGVRHRPPRPACRR